MDDYYTIVGVDRTASREAIDRAVREQLRRWQRRTNSPDLARRQAAERRVRQLSEARTVLLDEQRRTRYDRELDARWPSPAPPPSPPPLPARPAPLPPPPPPTRPAPVPPVRRVPVRKFPRLHGGRIGVAIAAGGASTTLAAVHPGLFLVGPMVVAVVAAFYDQRVVVSPQGVTVRGRGVRHYPWASIRAIEQVTVRRTLRVELHTVLHGRIRLPVPRGNPFVVDDPGFGRNLAEMRWWHDRYGPPFR